MASNGTGEQQQEAAAAPASNADGSSSTPTYPALGDVRCYWAIMDASMNFRFLDPVLESHLREVSLSCWAGASDDSAVQLHTASTRCYTRRCRWAAKRRGKLVYTRFPTPIANRTSKLSPEKAGLMLRETSTDVL